MVGAPVRVVARRCEVAHAPATVGCGVARACRRGGCTSLQDCARLRSQRMREARLLCDAGSAVIAGVVHMHGVEMVVLRVDETGVPPLFYSSDLDHY